MVVMVIRVNMAEVLGMDCKRSASPSPLSISPSWWWWRWWQWWHIWDGDGGDGKKTCRHSFITWPFFDPGSGVSAHVSVGASGGSCRIETTQKGEKYVRVAALMQLNCCNVAVSILLQLDSYTATLQFQQWCTVAVLMQFDSPPCDPIPSRDPGNQVGQPWLFQP